MVFEHIWVFKVQGLYRFPFWLLWRDACWPQDQESASRMDTPVKRRDQARWLREVTLVTLKPDGPDTGKWAASNWHVVECEKRELMLASPAGADGSNSSS